MESRLSKDDWLKAARMALIERGIGGVRVEVLARSLGVTKGSFYWHFPHRAALMEGLLREWEDEADLLIGALGGSGTEGLRTLVPQLAANVLASERGEVPSDAAIFAWAAIDPLIRERVDAAEEERVALLATLIGGRQKAELAYMAYLGFILRRRHSPNPQRAFALIGDLLLSLGGIQARPDEATSETNELATENG